MVVAHLVSFVEANLSLPRQFDLRKVNIGIEAVSCRFYPDTI